MDASSSKDNDSPRMLSKRDTTLSTDSTELLDHRRASIVLPKSAGSGNGLRDSPSQQPELRRATLASNGSDSPKASKGRDLYERFHQDVFAAEDEFGLEDSQELGVRASDAVTAGGNPQSGANRTRPRAGSHLDAVLQAPVRISPRVTYDDRGRPPSLDLDRTAAVAAAAAGDAVSRSSSTSSAPGHPRRNRRLSSRPMSARPSLGMEATPVNNKQERDSIEVPSRPDSEDNHSEEAEQDVCFPSEEVRSAEGIDFDELDEFVEEELSGLTRVETRVRRGSVRSVNPPRQDLKQELEYDEKSLPVTSESSSSNKQPVYLPHIHHDRDYSLRFASPNMRPQNMAHMQMPSLAQKLARPLGPSPRLTTSPSIPRPLTAGHLRQMERNQDAPDRFSFFTSERDETVHAPSISGLLGEAHARSFKDLFRADQGVWWLDVLCPSDLEMRVLAKAFGIHPLTAEDIRVQETREKVELFKSYYFVCFRSFDHDKDSEDHLEPVNIYLVVFKEGILSFHFEPTMHPANVRRRIRQLRDYLHVSSDWISYAIIDDITDVFMPSIHEMEQETDAIEDAVLMARSDDSGAMLRRIGECRKRVMALFRLLFGKADVIKQFAKRSHEGLSNGERSSEVGLYLGDIQDHVITMTQTLVQIEKILSRSHANYLAQLSVDSISMNNRLNKALGKITFIATMLVPCTLLTSAFGMNVAVPGRDVESLWPFFTLIGSMVLFVFVCFLYARRKGAFQ